MTTASSVYLSFTALPFFTPLLLLLLLLSRSFLDRLVAPPPLSSLSSLSAVVASAIFALPLPSVLLHSPPPLPLH